MSNKEHIAKELKTYRNRSKLKVQEVAKLLNVSQPYISMIENAKGNLPTKVFLKNYANIISDYINSEDAELIYGRLLLAAGYPVENLEKLVEDGRFFSNQVNRTYIEYIEEDSFRVLEKPYYNLSWLLNQTQNEVHIEVETNGKKRVQSLGEKDKKYLNKLINLYFEIKFMDEIEEVETK